MTKQVGIAYHDDYLLHKTNYHPERKERLEEVIHLLKKEKVYNRLTKILPRKATIEEVARVHKEEYINMVNKACSSGRTSLDMDTYLNKYTYNVALLAVGGGLEALDSVCSRQEPAFVLCRPPGHHAEPHMGMGFCIFNNIAIAAQTAKEKYGVERILIVDWDVHHGNGTQTTFIKDPTVLFFSIHQSPAFPGTGDLREIGVEEGIGFTVNVPMDPGQTDEDYKMVFENVLLPIAEKFKPQLVLISAGQDAHIRDPLASMRLSLSAYRWMTKQVLNISKKYCDGKILFFLEGGYDLVALSEAVLVIIDELAGFEIDLGREDLNSSYDLKIVKEKILEIKKQISPIWLL